MYRRNYKQVQASLSLSAGTMRRGRQDQFNAGRSSPSRGQGHRGGGAQQQPQRANVKRRPCQDIRGPQRLISYQIPNANSDKELGVIRAIIARETALADLLAHVSKYQPTLVTPTNGGSKLNCVTACFGALDQKTTDLLLGMRITSINVAESIQDWRSQLTLPRPFVWQKKNYLQGMGCDVDFLHFDGIRRHSDAFGGMRRHSEAFGGIWEKASGRRHLRGGIWDDSGRSFGRALG